MVVSPKELIKTNVEKVMARRLEEKIDGFLESHYRGKMVEVPYFSEISLMRDIVFADLLDRYRDAGWNHIGVKEGESITFSYVHSRYLGSFRTSDEVVSLDDTVIKLYG